jgi:hypothetical protein
VPYTFALWPSRLPLMRITTTLDVHLCCQWCSLCQPPMKAADMQTEYYSKTSTQHSCTAWCLLQMAWCCMRTFVEDTCNLMLGADDLLNNFSRRQQGHYTVHACITAACCTQVITLSKDLLCQQSVRMACNSKAYCQIVH